MKLERICKEHFPIWKELRQSLYKGVDKVFHDKEMLWIYESDDKDGFFIQSDSKGIVGFLELSVRNVVDGCIGDKIGYIEGLYITPQHRGHGIGREVVKNAIEWFRSHGCTEMATDTEIENTGAQSFFNRIGFKETGRIVQFKKNAKEI